MLQQACPAVGNSTSYQEVPQISSELQDFLRYIILCIEFVHAENDLKQNSNLQVHCISGDQHGSSSYSHPVAHAYIYSRPSHYFYVNISNISVASFFQSSSMKNVFQNRFFPKQRTACLNWAELLILSVCFLVRREHPRVCFYLLGV